jgi:hypothetical protein
VVHRLTKFSHFYAILTEYNAFQVADLFFMEVFRLHALPKNIVSDRYSLVHKDILERVTSVGGDRVDT